MTPAELKERRRDRELRKQWLQQKRMAEIKRLTDVADGIRSIKPEFPSLSPVLDLAIDAANLAIDALRRQAA
jgi:hypothetical protein